MNILLTNDDGISSEGISTLFETLSKQHNVYIIAPESERSACSSAITVRSHVKIQRIDGNRFSIDGYTVDCVNIGLHGKLIPEVDLVISGINHGPNLGDDVFFSGTVGGARSAQIFGISGIAVSIDCLGNSEYFRDASNFILNYINNFDRNDVINPVCLNINYPNIPADKISGIKYTYLCRREYRDSYKVMNKNESEMSLQLDGTIISKQLDGSDITEIKKGYISITPLSLDCTDYSYLDKMRNACC